MELVTLLNNSGLFKTALDICTTFSLPYNNVFETLTKHCVLLTEQEHPSAWNWLVENDLQGGSNLLFQYSKKVTVFPDFRFTC